MCLIPVQYPPTFSRPCGAHRQPEGAVRLHPQRCQRRWKRPAAAGPRLRVRGAAGREGLRPQVAAQRPAGLPVDTAQKAPPIDVGAEEPHQPQLHGVRGSDARAPCSGDCAAEPQHDRQLHVRRGQLPVGGQAIGAHAGDATRVAAARPAGGQPERSDHESRALHRIGCVPGAAADHVVSVVVGWTFG